MKQGLHTGQNAEAEIVITRDMQAAFEGNTVHELYSTSSLVHHMEWVARKIILPYLEEHEEGMGSYVEASHLMLTLPGMKVRLKATVSHIEDNKVTCIVEAFNSRGKIARGVITQTIVEKTWLSKKMQELSQNSQLAPQT